jgi:leucyl aminopeptidase
MASQSKVNSHRTGSLLPTFEVRSAQAGTVDTDVVAVFQDKGQKSISPKGEYASSVEKLRKSESFSGKAGQVLFLRLAGREAENGLLFGLGQPGELTEERLRAAGGAVWSRLVGEKARSVSIHLDSFFSAPGLKAELSHPRIARAFAEGMALASYQIAKIKASSKKDEYQAPTRISFLTKEQSLKLALEKELKRVVAVGQAVALTRDWSNEPSNVGTPVYFANEARKLANQYKLKCKIITEAEAKREKMELFLGVGQGSEREGRMVILEYIPRGVKNPKTLALVGKGVTFDSGGISIKPSMRMEDMKHDMTGAATVMGAILLASAWQVPNRVVAVLAFTENMPDGDAIQPGNILGSRAGKTVEVINTDAEGRLILADALDYAQDFKPDAIVDVATLTGAVSIALG